MCVSATRSQDPFLNERSPQQSSPKIAKLSTIRNLALGLFAGSLLTMGALAALSLSPLALVTVPVAMMVGGVAAVAGTAALIAAIVLHVQAKREADSNKSIWDK